MSVEPAALWRPPTMATASSGTDDDGAAVAAASSSTALLISAASDCGTKIKLLVSVKLEWNGFDLTHS